MKRFYKDVTVSHETDGYLVRLDGRAIKSPAKKLLMSPTLHLADLVAAEWDAQEDQVRPQNMPQTRFVGTAVDSFAHKRPETEIAIQAYAAGDLLSYWADAPEGLVSEQHRLWQPVLDWVTDKYGVEIRTTTNLSSVTQSDETVSRLSEAVSACDDFHLVPLSIATGSLGSLILALALVEQEIDAETAFNAAQVEETFQISQWGEDAEATIRREGQLSELRELQRYIAALAAV